MVRKDCDSSSHRSYSRRVRYARAALIVMSVPLTAASVEAATVRMWPTSTIDRDRILVRDVAHVLDVEPSQADRYGSVTVRPAPKPGQAADVSLDELREALVRAGANPVEFRVCGSTQCHVVRALTLHVVEEPDDGSAGSRYWWPARATDGEPQGDIPSASHEITVTVPEPQGERKTLEEVLREFVAEKTAGLGGRSHVRFSANVRDALALRKPEYDFRVHWRSERRLGSCGIEVDVRKDGRRVQTIPMIAEVSVTLPVVSAVKPINRGQVVRESDVCLEKRDFFHTDRIGLTELEAVIGQQARRLIHRGEMVRHRDLRPRPLIRRGDLVTVWSQAGGLRVKTVVKALEDGTFGELIEVRNEASGEKFRVSVVAPQTAKVVSRPSIEQEQTLVSMAGGSQKGAR